jgi:hypothetical protein
MNETMSRDPATCQTVSIMAAGKQAGMRRDGFEARELAITREEAARGVDEKADLAELLKLEQETERDGWRNLGVKDEVERVCLRLELPAACRDCRRRKR